MDGFIIDVVGYQKEAEPPPEVQSGESALLQKMKRAYDDFFETDYKKGLCQDGEKEPIYPRFNLIKDEEVEEIVLDYIFFE